MDDIDPCLEWILRRAGDEWGALGVAVAAARLADPNVVVAHLSQTPRRRRSDARLDLPERDWRSRLLPSSEEECIHDHRSS